jgi:hypothetical protein
MYILWTCTSAQESNPIHKKEEKKPQKKKGNRSSFPSLPETKSYNLPLIPGGFSVRSVAASLLWVLLNGSLTNLLPISSEYVSSLLFPFRSLSLFLNPASWETEPSPREKEPKSPKRCIHKSPQPKVHAYPRFGIGNTHKPICFSEPYISQALLWLIYTHFSISHQTAYPLFDTTKKNSKETVWRTTHRIVVHRTFSYCYSRYSIPRFRAACFCRTNQLNNLK